MLGRLDGILGRLLGIEGREEGRLIDGDEGLELGRLIEGDDGRLGDGRLTDGLLPPPPPKLRPPPPPPKLRPPPPPPPKPRAKTSSAPMKLTAKQSKKILIDDVFMFVDSLCLILYGLKLEHSSRHYS